MINLSIIGLGSMGLNHLRVLSKNKEVNIKYIVDKDFKKIKTIAKIYNVNFTTNLKKAIDCSDAIVIATTTTSHFKLFLKCSHKIKNFFVEKPISAEMFEIQKIIKIIKKKHIKFHAGFIERYGPAISVVKKIINSKLIFCQFTRTNKTKKRALDIDVLDDLMIHDIDLAINIFGKISQVQCSGHFVNNKIVHASVFAKHENGGFSQFLASRITEKKQRLINVTLRDSYIEANLLLKEVLVYKNTFLKSKPEGYQVTATTENISVPAEESLQLQHEDFIRLCNGKKNKSPTAYESLEVAKVINLIKKNLYANKKSNK
jgi:predicted dehydrogenase